MFGFNYGLDDDPISRQLRLLRTMGQPQAAEETAPVSNEAINRLGLIEEMRPGAQLQTGPGRIGSAFLDPTLLDRIQQMRPDAFSGLLQQGPKSDVGNEIVTGSIPKTPTGSANTEVAVPGVSLRGAQGASRANAPQPPDDSGQVQTGILSAPTAPTAYASANAPLDIRKAAMGPANTPSATMPTIPTQTDGGGFDRFMSTVRDNSDMFMGLGAGLASGRNWGEGISKGLELGQKGAALASANKLAQAKTATEMARLQGAAATLKRAYRNLSDQEALGLAGNPAVVQEAMKRLNPTETFKTETDEKGNVWKINTLNNDRALLKSAEEDKTRRDLTPDEVKARGLQPGSYQVDTYDRVYPVSPPQRAVLTPQEEAQKTELVAKAEAGTKRLTDLAKGGDQAQVDLYAAQRLQSLLNTTDPGMKTAIMEEVRTRTGIALDPKAPTVQAVSAAIEHLANRQHVPGTGPQTDRDLESFRRQVPSLLGTPGGNDLVMQVMGGLAQRRALAAQIGQEYVSGQISREAADQRLNALPNPFEAWKQYQGQTQPANNAQAGTIRYDAQGRRIP